MSSSLHNVLKRIHDDWDHEDPGCQLYESYILEVIGDCRRSLISQECVELHLKPLLSANSQREFNCALAELQWAAYFAGKGLDTCFGGEGDADIKVNYAGDLLPVEVYTPQGMLHESETWNQTANGAFLLHIRHAYGYEFMLDTLLEKRNGINPGSSQNVGLFMAKALNKISISPNEVCYVYAPRINGDLHSSKAVIVKTGGCGFTSNKEWLADELIGVYDADTNLEPMAILEIAPVLTPNVQSRLFCTEGIPADQAESLLPALMAHYESREYYSRLGLTYRVRVRRINESVSPEYISTRLLTALNESNQGLPLYKHRSVLLIYGDSKTNPSSAAISSAILCRDIRSERSNESFRDICESLERGKQFYMFVGYVKALALQEGESKPSIVMSMGGGGQSDGMYLSEGLSSKIHQLPKGDGGFFAVTANKGFGVSEFTLQQLMGRISITFNSTENGKSKNIIGGPAARDTGIFAGSRRLKGLLLGQYDSQYPGKFRVWGFAPNPYSFTGDAEKMAREFGAEKLFLWRITEDDAEFSSLDLT